tara:strand:- start:825 stop:1532 length:708 start_codon:yes stop_codon:yes gene_type:complete
MTTAANEMTPVSGPAELPAALFDPEEPMVPDLASSVDPLPSLATPVYRKLTAHDQALVEAHLQRLEPHDRHLRFWGGMTDQAIKDYCDRLDWSAAVLVGAFIDGELRGVGELVRIRLVPQIMAEVAFSVEGPWQNAGVGTELVRRILTIARNRCIDRVYMLCLSENKKMQKIASKFEMILSYDEGEVEARILPAWPSYMSLMAEAVDDSQAWFSTIFDPSFLWPQAEDGPKATTV